MIKISTVGTIITTLNNYLTERLYQFIVERVAEDSCTSIDLEEAALDQVVVLRTDIPVAVRRIAVEVGTRAEAGIHS